MNQEILDKIITQDYQHIQKKIEEFLVQQVEITNSKGVIFGLSGGIDSTVIAFLCAKVLKEKTLAIVMPDSKVSPKEETEDALKIIEDLGLNYKLLDINLIRSGFAKYLEPNDKALGNLSARIRANILYYYANAKNYLVIGSSDKSEFLIGYFTKFGDGSADILPIVSLYKTQIRKFAQHLGVPENIISKKSSPNLWKNHIAEVEIGATYEEIDSVLYCMVDNNYSIEETAKMTKIDKNIVQKIHYLYNNSQHKRISAMQARIE